MNEKTKENIIDIDNQTILERDKYDELITKAVFILLAIMKMKTNEIKSKIKSQRSGESLKDAFTMLEEIEEEYNIFEDNLDEAEKDEELKKDLKEAAREVIKKYGKK